MRGVIGLVANDLTLAGVLLAGLGVMATVVGVLWKIIAGRNAEDAKKLAAKEQAEEDRLRRLEKQSDECDEDRKQLAGQIAELAKRIPGGS